MSASSKRLKTKKIKNLIGKVENNPEDIDSCVHLAEIYREENKLHLAMDYYQLAILISPTVPEYHNELGLILEEEGNLLEALRSYKAALVTDSSYAEAHNNIGNIYHSKGDLDKAQKSYKKALKIDPKLAAAHNNLGNVKVDLGQSKSALDCFRKAIEIDSKMTEPYINLANLQRDMGKKSAAINNYKAALAINPKDKPTRHNLNALLGKTTRCAPDRYVSEVFDDYASKFDSHLICDLKYSMPSKLRDSLNKFKAKKTFKRGLDLGCGTGICGTVFEDKVKEFIGMDLSINMLEKARDRGIYSELVHGDIKKLLAVRADYFDFFIAADVFIYVGELRELFSLIKVRSTKRAILLFSTEHLNEGKSYKLLDTGRYAHSEGYIDNLIAVNDFKKLSFSINNLRKENGEWIQGGTYLLET